MGDHVVLDVEDLVKDKSAVSDSASNGVNNGKEEEKLEAGDESQPLIQISECRICQEEDNVKNLETPCACSGSLKYAHRACVQRWCNEKGDITCEICHQMYKPGYIPPPPRSEPDETAIDLSGGWTGLELRDPRILSVAAARRRRLLEAEYNEYVAARASVSAFLRSAALILMALLLLRHALTITNDEGDDDDASTIFSLFLLRAAGFLLPCYIMAWAISVLQRRRQRQEAAAMAAAEVAFILQTGRRRALHFAIAPDSPATPQHEPV
ncbi:hypothetical protein LUZ60_004312 [Juncus effusus]|nr:hypothetical protein LUZ60_004312 [Juncus effusus]